MDTVTLTLTKEQLQIVAAGLGELPLKISGEVFALVKKQAEEQLNAPKEASE